MPRRGKQILGGEYVPEGHRKLAGCETTGTRQPNNSRPSKAQEIDLILRPSRARILCRMIPGAAGYALTPGYLLLPLRGILVGSAVRCFSQSSLKRIATIYLNSLIDYSDAFQKG
jgi:hypothetical protein